MSTLKAWHLRSGGLDCVHLGPTAKAAFIAAVRHHNPSTLGVICEVHENDVEPSDETTFYFHVENTLRAAGLWKGEA